MKWLGGASVQILVDGDSNGGLISVISIEADEGYFARRHIHANEAEVFVVPEGSITVWVDDASREVAKDGVAILPRGIPHSYRIDMNNTRILNLCTPGGLDRFFRQVATELQSIPTDDLALAELLVARLGSRYGITYI